MSEQKKSLSIVVNDSDNNLAVNDEFDNMRLKTNGLDADDELYSTFSFPAPLRIIQFNISGLYRSIGAINCHLDEHQGTASLIRKNFEEVVNVKWSDIAGQESVKQKLRETFELPLKHSEAFLQTGIKPSKSLLMYGLPGCSKTMLAKALETESKLHFINVKGLELFSKWVRGSKSAIQEVFRKARENAPSIVFIDEIDAIGGKRPIENADNNERE
ncbi:uncharacterized protein LOC130671384 [Microplitis mediator]|uniref:uncharacterized protein LOC130671384 n=1 Tax=Microplitis mediator TaxID=375433 RepID=UPI002555EF9C|nr:uncharacterized protein LOC130671384 [Microplitis mediator]